MEVGIKFLIDKPTLCGILVCMENKINKSNKRDQVEKLLGFPIPKKLDFMFQRLIVQGLKVEEIADRIETAINNPLTGYN